MRLSPGLAPAALLKLGVADVGDCGPGRSQRRRVQRRRVQRRVHVRCLMVAWPGPYLSAPLPKSFGRTSGDVWRESCFKYTTVAIDGGG